MAVLLRHWSVSSKSLNTRKYAVAIFLDIQRSFDKVSITKVFFRSFLVCTNNLQFSYPRSTLSTRLYLIPTLIHFANNNAFWAPLPSYIVTKTLRFAVARVEAYLTMEYPKTSRALEQLYLAVLHRYLPEDHISKNLFVSCFLFVSFVSS